MREIPLSRGMVALVDDRDYETVTAVGKWYADRSYRTFYARKNFNREGRTTCIKMHNLIMDALHVDHVNGNGLDNRRSNLRLATSSQNSMNRGLRSDNKSGFKGVHWSVQRRCWVAQINKEGVAYRLGRFQSAQSAALAYDQAAADLFGEYARVNFPSKETA